MRARTIHETDKSLRFLRSQLEVTSIVEVRQAIYGLIESQTKSAMLANVREEYAFRVIDPPVTPESGEFVRPKRKLIVAVGVFVGLSIGVVIALISAIEGKRRSPGDPTNPETIREPRA
jgi:LPS O-antigen subunit length determinant protein (WzzB/FepE family)